jgi:hypothetical protein
VSVEKFESYAGIRSRREVTGKAVINAIELYPLTSGAAVTASVHAFETGL